MPVKKLDPEIVYKIVEGCGDRGMWPSEIANKLNTSKHNVKTALLKLQYDGRIHQIGSFWYPGAWAKGIHALLDKKRLNDLLNEAWIFISQNHKPSEWPPGMQEIMGDPDINDLIAAKAAMTKTEEE